MNRVRRAAAAAAFLSCSALASEIGDEIAAQVSIATYQHYLENLLYTHQGMSRGVNGAEHDLARANIVSTLAGFGLDVELHPFVYNNVTYYNVVATQPGVLDPDQIYVVGAHYDSVNNPGADDDASGVAGVLELARILSQYDTAYTIRYCAWDREEQGLIGSTSYVAERRWEAVRGMIQIDMVAHDSGGNRQALYPALGGVNPLADGLVAAFPLYGNGTTVIRRAPSTFSDHAPFARAGYDAIAFVEDNYLANSCYHQACDHVDQPDYIYYPFATNLVRVIGGYLADNALVWHVDDCDGDDLSDAAEIAGNPALDCNANGVLDSCEPGIVRDCNANAVTDLCEIGATQALDSDRNGILDACQTTRRVPQDYATVQAAIDAATDGDEVLIAAGTYSGPGNSLINVGGKVLTIRGEAGPTACIIDAGAALRGFLFQTDEGPATVLRDLTLRGSTRSAVFCNGTSPTIVNCIVTGVSSSLGDGGAIALTRRANPLIVGCKIIGNSAAASGGISIGLGCRPLLLNCVIAENTGGAGGGAMLLGTALPTFVNCTIAANAASGIGGGFYLMQEPTNRSLLTLQNCIVWGNTAGTQGPQIYAGPTTAISATSCDVQGGQAAIRGGGAVSAWTNNRDVNPHFALPGAGDYRLLAPSPCIDSGDNALLPPDRADLDHDLDALEAAPLDFAGRARRIDDPATPDSGQGASPLVDIGAFEFAPACAGDVNGDGRADLLDLATLLTNYGVPGGATRGQGDLDADGDVDLADLAALLIVFGTSC
jgi:Peptidase family M28/Right handed beta helix region